MVDVAIFAAFLVVVLTARRAIEQVGVGVVVHRFRVADQIIAGGCFRQFGHVNIGDLAQSHRSAELELEVRRVCLLRQHGGGEKDLGVRARGDLVGVLDLAREHHRHHFFPGIVAHCVIL